MKVIYYIRTLTCILFGLYSGFELQAQRSNLLDTIPATSTSGEFAIDLSGLAMSLNFAGRRRNHLRFGASVTYGVEFASFILSNRNYSTLGNSDFTFHFLALHLFARSKKRPGAEAEYGVRWSAFSHSDDGISGDSPFGTFVGVYLQPTFGKGWFKFGFRTAWGVFNEDSERDGGGFGMEITPLFRLNFNRKRNK